MKVGKVAGPSRTKVQASSAETQGFRSVFGDSESGMALY